ncbi:helix-turn-helix domain-containing protein [Ruminococcaceae bacterium OttesenSCG-928-D13]|nr:helix-turn-helix domain-containing protein [Ruminococcaceae bacterium OttesenSCG-928-D13]
MSLYTVKEAAEILRTNPTYVYSLIHKNLLPAMKLGQFKIRKESLEKFIESCEGKDLTDLDNICPLSQISS